MSNADFNLALRVAQLERKLRIAVTLAVVSAMSGVAVLLAAVSDRAAAATEAKPPISDVLRVRRLDIVDPNGITRATLGAPLPNAVVNGRHLTRGGAPDETMSGMLLFDAQGVERSGYATADKGYSNVLLTLDDKNTQHAMFIAEPNGATTLRLFNGNTKDRVDVAMDGGGPSISMVRRGKEIYRIPANR